MIITLSDSETKTLQFYLDKAILDAKGMVAVGVGNPTSVKNLESIKQKLSSPVRTSSSKRVYEVQLGRVADGAKDDDVDYQSSQSLLIDSDHEIKIKEIEDAFSNEIRALGYDCVYSITPVENWELRTYYRYYDTLSRYEAPQITKKQSDKEQYKLFTKLHNTLLDNLGIDADKEEREDSFSAILDIRNGEDMKQVLIDTFADVYGVEISDETYDFCCALCTKPQIPHFQYIENDKPASSIAENNRRNEIGRMNQEFARGTYFSR